MSRLTRVVVVLAMVAGGALLAAGPGYRVELWSLETAFLLIRVALFLGLGTALLAVVLLGVPSVRIGETGSLVAALVLAVGVAAVPLRMLYLARTLPPIHDISTDTTDPPQFIALAAARERAPNGVEYGGPELARQQGEAYPAVRPLQLSAPPQDAFAEALESARTMGWEIVASDPARGRIEAVAMTFWFGFKDDIVIRLRPVDGGSRIDVRSASRVGVSDLGTNAARIRTLLQQLQ